MTEQATADGVISNERLGNLRYRCAGPFRGGRVVAVAGHPRDPMTFYFGACAGGVWKTVDGGTFWECISDGYLRTAAVGAIAVSESDPTVLYIGTGETTIRGDVSHGDGVYRSHDGGRTWQNMGLADTRHISKVRVHPTNPDLVYAAALGHAWGPNEERGLYRSSDGGEHWERILFRSRRAGAIDLSMDPGNPRILYCAMWEGYRTPYSLVSGGPGSSLYRSTDGGDTWTEISHAEGLPKGELGKIGLAVSPAREGRVWALIEAEDGGLFRSEDGGESWTCVCDNADLRRRAWYYMHLYADPSNADSVWVLNLQAWHSIDGGANFTAVPTPHGDNHDLWIDPQNSERLVEGNDGGACVSFNGGRSWSTILNQPTAQFYHVTADTATPYRLYGSQQDNTAISVPSASTYGAITEIEWFVPGGGESGYIAVRPDEPTIQYAGDHRGLLTRHDRRTGQQRVIDIWPETFGMYEGAEDLRYRFQWTYPIFLSPFDPHVLYVAAERLFRSTDEGSTWEAISPDLTRHEASTLGPSGGPLTRDNTGAETYATIFAAEESPHAQGTFWVGTDDGLVHLSRDNGQSWQDITPPDLKSPSGEWALISIIDLSPHDAATAYLAATRYKLDDNRPYLFKTNDWGQTWTAIIDGLPEDDFTRVVRVDPGCPGLLFAGTETGVYVSFDDGGHWEPLQTNLPVCPIHDLIVKGDDLVIGTHGRSFWILDDITPLRTLARDRGERTRLFRPADTIRFKIYEGFGGGEAAGIMYRMAGPVTYAYRQRETPAGGKEVVPIDAGQNRPNGVIVTYYLAEGAPEDIRLAIRDAGGNLIREFRPKPEEDKDEEEADKEEAAVQDDPTVAEAAEGGEALLTPEADEEAQEPYLPVEPGINRFVWNFRYRNATRIPDNKFSEFATAGPPVPPGEYEVQLRVGSDTFSEQFQILPDPRVSATPADFQAQYDLGLKLRDAMSRLSEAVIRIRAVREQLEGWAERLEKNPNAGEVRAQARELSERLTAIEDDLFNTKATSRMLYPPPNVPTRLAEKLARLGGVIASADAAPPRQATEVYDELQARLGERLDALGALLRDEVPAFNERMRGLEIPAVVIPEH